MYAVCESRLFYFNLRRNLAEINAEKTRKRFRKIQRKIPRHSAKAMALTKEKKQQSLADLKANISKQKSVVFADFSKVNSKDLFSLRKQLKEAGCALKIAKKTLVRIAFGQSNISFWNKIKPHVPGQLALVFGMEDEVAPARISHTFVKKNENFKILGGIFEKRFIDKERVLVLANIPTRNELLGRLVGSLASSMTGFVTVLDNIRKSKQKSNS